MNRHPINAGKGRKKGSKNKVPRVLKDAILSALAELGGVAYLVHQGEKNPNAFLALLGRVLPIQVKEGGAEPLMPRDVIHVHRDT